MLGKERQNRKLTIFCEAHLYPSMSSCYALFYRLVKKSVSCGSVEMFLKHLAFGNSFIVK